MGHWQDLAHFQPLGATEKKEGGLGHCEGLREPQVWSLGWVDYDKLHPLMRALCQGSERQLLYQRHRSQHRESRKMDRRIGSKQKNKTPETDLHEMEISDLA